MKFLLGRRRAEPVATPGRQPAAAFKATPAGWLYVADQPATAAASYLSQLEEEGRAFAISEGMLVPWEQIYALETEDVHRDSLPLLSLPPNTDSGPCLSAEGVPSDPAFRVRVTGWTNGAQGPGQITTRVGPIVETASGPRRVSQPVWELLRRLEALAATGASASADDRLLAMGQIQKLARAAGAPLDGYLTKSPVIVSETLDLDLAEDRVGDVPVVEVIPRPDGAPEGWLPQFDSFDSVQKHYDVVESDGALTRVVLSEPVREVAAAIKQMPARRLGGNEAASFIQNPYPYLGEGAEAVVAPERIERAKQAAGIIEWEVEAQPEAEGWGLVLIDPVGTQESKYLGSIDLMAARSLLAAATDARTEGLGAFRWRGWLLALTGATLESLTTFQRTSVEDAQGNRLGADAIFDLSAYSDRVIGFDGKPVLVPRVAQPDAGSEWIPDEVPGMDVDSIDPRTGAVSTSHLTPEDVSELERRVAQAVRERAPTVRVPRLESDMPVEEARIWMEAIKDRAHREERPIPAPKNPAPSPRLALQILHNIEELEYDKAGAVGQGADRTLLIPTALRTDIELMPHQRDGVAWMQCRMGQNRDGVRGILLADDMGLGKTLQSLCLMAWYRETAPSPRPCLVVAPVSLLENWKGEIDKFLDGTQGHTVTLYGEHLAQHRLHPSEFGPELRERGLKKALRPGFARDAAFVLTTYETLRDYQVSFARERWGVLVCDEAQKIKTPGAMVTRAAKAMQADFKIACTGTPVENSLADLWCLFDFFQPGALDSLAKFTREFRQSIERREPGHEAVVEQLRGHIAPLVLRRMKNDVAQLPPKTEVPCEMPMSARQRTLYAAAAKEFREAVDKNDGSGGAVILALLHRLRMICANPVAAADPESDRLGIDEHLRDSPKLSWLIKQLEQIEPRGEKVIVFSEYRDIQRLVCRAVAHRFGFRPSIVNGSTSVDPAADASRQAIIDAFQAAPGFGVIVLSTTAVGFGVNVQKANHVIHFTRPWNPAKEDQATDRAYRIGQDREVFVYCPTVVGDGFESFEQRVASRLAAKRALSRDMLMPEVAIGIDEFNDLSA